MIIKCQWSFKTSFEALLCNWTMHIKKYLVFREKIFLWSMFVILIFISLSHLIQIFLIFFFLFILLRQIIIAYFLLKMKALMTFLIAFEKIYYSLNDDSSCFHS